MTQPGTACITGASAGIGAAFARRLARDGYDLILHGRREPQLKTLCEELQRAHHVSAEYVCAELSSPDDLHRLEERVRAEPALALLVNNAGFGTRGRFGEEDINLQDAMIQTHITAPVRLTYAALPGMLSRKTGAIINVSSVAGFLVSPGSVIYCATKAALTSFSESLNLELRGTGVCVQALCPGFTRSEFHQRLGIDTSGDFFRHFMDAGDVVDASMRCLRRGRVVCIPGLKYKFAAIAPRFLPRRVVYGLGNLYQKMRRNSP